MTQPGQPESERPVPTSTEEALAIARTCFQPRCPDGSLAPLNVQEFDLGYLVYATFPPRPDPTVPPEQGGSHLVISKATGELGYVPNLPPEVAIPLYRKHYGPRA
ncbi:hypothetical protein ABZW18_20330 [Streptomyces sp. NPDC004647]|uniref:hypothetical protein n=1 Tax=Streptomyces sp. NPDC004647 TaxID=3154671 RepID=UPI0033BC54C0